MSKKLETFLFLAIVFLSGMMTEAYLEYRESLPKKPAVIQKWIPRKDTFKGLERV